MGKYVSVDKLKETILADLMNEENSASIVETISEISESVITEDTINQMTQEHEEAIAKINADWNLKFKKFFTQGEVLQPEQSDKGTTEEPTEPVEPLQPDTVENESETPTTEEIGKILGGE